MGIHLGHRVATPGSIQGVAAAGRDVVNSGAILPGPDLPMRPMRLPQMQDPAGVREQPHGDWL